MGRRAVLTLSPRQPKPWCRAAGHQGHKNTGAPREPCAVLSMNVPGMTALGHCQEERDAPCPTFLSCPCLGLDLFALYPECSTGKAKVNGLWTMLLRMYGPAFTLPLSCRGGRLCQGKEQDPLPGCTHSLSAAC